jgi:uncharacterized paraquat-inducible protein A
MIKRQKRPKKIKKILKLANAKHSKRFCVNCEEMRKFKYDKMIGHSRCTICGSNYSRRKSWKRSVLQ